MAKMIKNKQSLTKHRLVRLFNNYASGEAGVFAGTSGSLPPLGVS